MNVSAANSSQGRGEYNEHEKAESLAGKYLTFALGNAKFGLDILKIQEIIGVIDITRMPSAPHFIKGIINLRGKVIPLVDLRLKLSMEEKDYDEKTCFIVVTLEVGSQSALVAVAVDTVLEVANFRPENIQPSSNRHKSGDTAFIIGMGKMNDEVYILVDIEEVLELEHYSVLRQFE